MYLKKRQLFLLYFIYLYNFVFQSTFIMTEKHQEDLVHIRSMMERSSRFISLSGLSGVFAGLSALLGGVSVYQLFKVNGIEYFEDNHQLYSTSLITELILTAFVILFFALAFGIFFTVRKSKKLNLPIWTSATKNMLFNLAIPLIAGAVFCFALVYHQMFILVAPSTLIFYGLALLNAEKYTYSDIKYLGFSEVILGSIALFFVGYGLVFWILGFGILHIFYGLLLFKKYK